jgi:hypothetical protein
MSDGAPPDAPSDMFLEADLQTLIQIFVSISSALLDGKADITKIF